MSNKLRFAVRQFAPFESTILKSWELFCAKNKCNMELDLVAMDLTEFCKSTIGSDEGLVRGDWDIATLNSDWIAQVATGDMVEDLTPYIANRSPIGFPDGWSKAMREMQEYDGKILGLPFHNGPECLIYRKDLFESSEEQAAFQRLYGRPLRVPKSWEELIEVSHFFHRPEQGFYGTIIAAYPDGHNTVFDFCLQLWTRGGELLDSDGKLNINTPEAASGLRFYQRLMSDKEAIHPESQNLDSVRAGVTFAHGEAAMLLNWFGFASMCEVVEDSVVKGKVGIANIPAAGESGEPVSLNAYWLYTIAKGSRNKSVAYDFIHFLTAPEQDKLLTLEGGIGCRLSTWQDEEVNRIVPYYRELEEIHQYSRSLPQRVYWSQIEEIIDGAMISAIESTQPIEEILKEAQQRINDVESSYESR